MELFYLIGLGATWVWMQYEFDGDTKTSIQFLILGVSICWPLTVTYLIIILIQDRRTNGY